MAHVSSILSTLSVAADSDPTTTAPAALPNFSPRNPPICRSTTCPRGRRPTPAASPRTAPWSAWSRPIRETTSFRPAQNFQVRVRKYRVPYLLVDVGWVDFNLCDPLSCPAAQPRLPNSHLPRQNWADSGTVKIQINPTQSSPRADGTPCG